MSNYVELMERVKGGQLTPVRVRRDAVYIVREQVLMGPSAAKVVRGVRTEEPTVEGVYCDLICARGVGISVDGTAEEVIAQLEGSSTPPKGSEKSEKSEKPR